MQYTIIPYVPVGIKETKKKKKILVELDSTTIIGFRASSAIGKSGWFENHFTSLNLLTLV